MVVSPAIPSTRRVEDLRSPPGLPLFGNFHQLLKFDELHRRLERWEAELGNVFTIRMLSKQVLVTSDPKLANIALHERPEVFRRISTIETVADELELNGLFSVEGAAWFRQRNLILHALGPNQLPEFFPTLRKITDRLRMRWQRIAESRGVTDVVEDLTRYTVDVTTSLSFGQDVNTLEHEEDAVQQHLALIFPKLTSRIFTPPYWHYVKLPSDRRLDRSLTKIRLHVQQLIDNARADLQAQGNVPKNLLQTMLSAAAEPKSGITDKDVCANVLTLLLAGEDTTAHALAWTLFFLSQRPDLRALLQAEANEVLGDATIAPDYETTAKLALFDGAAFEALRFKPVTPVIGLEANQDFVLGDIFLPAGTQVFLCSRPAMMDDRYFANAKEFEPSRWSRRSEGTTSRQAFTQFGAGPRVCPGRSLAIREIRMVLSMLCRNFSFELVGDPSNIREIFSFTMKPSSVPLRLSVLH
jgi:cytochrome P450